MAVAVCDKLKAHGAVPRGPHIEECGLITVVGSGFWQSPETLDAIQNIIPEPRLLDVKNNAITIALSADKLTDALTSLHQGLIGSAGK
jgi:hypothetical protein